jgi:hypothetical protein
MGRIGVGRLELRDARLRCLPVGHGLDTGDEAAFFDHHFMMSGRGESSEVRSRAQVRTERGVGCMGVGLAGRNVAGCL